MSFSAGTSQRGAWVEVLTVVAVILGMLAGFSVVGTPAAHADAACADADGVQFDFNRLQLELSEVGDDGTLSIDTADPIVTCASPGGNALQVFYNGVPVITSGGSDSPNFHLSCSDDIGAYDISIDGVEYTVDSFVLDSLQVNNPEYKGFCDEIPDDEPTCEDFTGSQVPPECWVPVSLEKVDGDQSALEGATFELRDGDAVVGSCTSLADGSCSIGLVEPGTYTLVETDAPDGYNGAIDLPKQVEVTYAADGEVVLPVDLGTYVNTLQTCVDTEDCPVPVTLRKLDETQSPLAGASFLLDGETDYTCTSDALGLCDFGDVALGDYTLSETAAPDGYTSLVLTAEQQAVSVTFGPESIELGPFVNTPLTCVDTQDCPVPVTLQKIDDDEAPLAGASFLLDGDTDYTCTSDGAGLCDFGDVALGDYTLSETAAPDGYTSLVLTAEQQAVSVAFGPESIELGPFVNTPIPPPPAIDLVKTAVVGDGATDGDLVTDPETGLPTLSFSSGSPGDQTAVYEYTITNTGPVTLFNVTLTDDRLGTILDEGQGVTLEPGESTTERASETFSIEDASGGIDNIITNTAVTTGVDSEGTEVSATDDAVIQLTAQQSSILIDLEKIAVVGAGDVEAVDGAPTLTWQEAELDANEAKTIRYRFTITNIGPSTLHDIELTDDMLSDAPLIPATDGLTLEPGESEVIEVDHTVTPEDVFPDDPEVVGGQIQGDLLNTASVRGSNATRDAFDEDSDDAAVLVRAPRAEILAADALPAAGFEAGSLVPLSLLLLWLGAVAIWLTDRPRPLRH